MKDYLEYWPVWVNIGFWLFSFGVLYMKLLIIERILYNGLIKKVDKHETAIECINEHCQGRGQHVDERADRVDGRMDRMSIKVNDLQKRSYRHHGVNDTR